MWSPDDEIMKRTLSSGSSEDIFEISNKNH